jgi:hypothetical protein
VGREAIDRLDDAPLVRRALWQIAGPRGRKDGWLTTWLGLPRRQRRSRLNGMVSVNRETSLCSEM